MSLKRLGIIFMKYTRFMAHAANYYRKHTEVAYKVLDFLLAKIVAFAISCLLKSINNIRNIELV